MLMMIMMTKLVAVKMIIMLLRLLLQPLVQVQVDGVVTALSV